MDIPLNKKRFTPAKIAMLVRGLALLALLAFVLISSGGSSKLNVQKERISISTAQQGIFQENVPVNGIVLPITTIYLDALEGGRVEEKYVEDGAILEAGDPILPLSNTDLELSLENAGIQSAYPDADFSKCCPPEFNGKAKKTAE